MRLVEHKMENVNHRLAAPSGWFSLLLAIREKRWDCEQDGGLPATSDFIINKYPVWNAQEAKGLNRWVSDRHTNPI